MSGSVLSVSRSAVHGFSKRVVPEITLLEGLGVEGDAHAGKTVQHRYMVRKDPFARNLCQVHLIHAELFEELAQRGFAVSAGEMGENVTTRGVDLLGLGRGALLHLGSTAVVEITGLREPCSQLNGLRAGLMKACMKREAGGSVIRRAGIMGIVVAGGVLRSGDGITVKAAGRRVELGPV